MTSIRRSHRSKKREEGIVMLVVMLVLLMVTATGVFAAHSTSIDIRAAGYSRIAMQTRNLAATSLLSMADYTERQGVQTVMATISRQNRANIPLMGVGSTATSTLAPGKEGARFFAEDLAVGSTSIAPPGLFGTREARSPITAVDVYDTHAFSIPIVGHRADGLSPFRFVRMTFTARARARFSSPGERDTASDARAHIVAGPAFF